eukprot:TRINITY_DN2502_c0_g1_i1.p2 TRINITY_DN2502_c0_g1~~TRINITY_DN2502_c0_g1_i1.p2  ORF type:complete len:203 (+),score=41.25 TRINITY_DN2502_c0_g1_i1:78-611(+)
MTAPPSPRRSGGESVPLNAVFDWVTLSAAARPGIGRRRGYRSVGGTPSALTPLPERVFSVPMGRPHIPHNGEFVSVRATPFTCARVPVGRSRRSVRSPRVRSAPPAAAAAAALSVGPPGASWQAPPPQPGAQLPSAAAQTSPDELSADADRDRRIADRLFRGELRSLRDLPLPRLFE